MNRAIKFKLKNGKVVTIRRVCGTDYDAVVKFFDKAVRDKSVKYTSLYLGQPKQNKDSFVAMLKEKSAFIVFALATATDTTITNQALIDQLEALVAGGAENGTTYIKVLAADPNLPGLLVVEAPKYE